MSRAVLSLGGNIGDAQAYLDEAVRSLSTLPGVIVDAVSPTYVTPPWGGVEQQDFLNLTLIAHDDAGPEGDGRQWLARAQRLEDAAQRTREVRWGPRTLDVDVIAVDDLRSEDLDLTLPHPRAHLRAFVLVPWLDIDPEARLQGRPVSDWLAAPECAVDRAALRRVDAGDAGAAAVTIAGDAVASTTSDSESAGNGDEPA